MWSVAGKGGTRESVLVTCSCRCVAQAEGERGRSQHWAESPQAEVAIRGRHPPSLRGHRRQSREPGQCGDRQEVPAAGALWGQPRGSLWRRRLARVSWDLHLLSWLRQPLTHLLPHHPHLHLISCPSVPQTCHLPAHTSLPTPTSGLCPAQPLRSALCRMTCTGSLTGS